MIKPIKTGLSIPEQTNEIKRYLKSGKALSSIDAVSRWGCTRLAAVVMRLEKAHGYKISRQTIHDPQNPKRHWKIYWLYNITEVRNAQKAAGLKMDRSGRKKAGWGI